MRGYFNLGKGEEDNYVIGSVYPIYLSKGVNFAAYPSREGADLIIQSGQPLQRFERFSAKIEDCLVLEKTYIDTVDFK